MGLIDETSIKRIYTEEKIRGHFLSICLRSQWFITTSCFDHIWNDKFPNDSRRIMPFVASTPFWFLAAKYALENSSIVHVVCRFRCFLVDIFSTCGKWFPIRGCFSVQTEHWSDRKHFIFVLIFFYIHVLFKVLISIAFYKMSRSVVAEMSSIYCCNYLY